jgi:GT2 family glycosyltransferase
MDGDIGPFSRRFFNFFEDTDLNFRAKELGIPLKIVWVPVRHIGHVTAKDIGLSKMYTESRQKFLEIWGGK